MAFNIRISKFTDINGLEHIATSYQIATDPNGNNIAHSLIKSTLYLNLYPAPINPVLGDVYWVRFKRHYKDKVTLIESEGDWTTFKSYRPNITTSELILYNEVYIEKPLVIIDKTSLVTSSEFVKVSTTDFRCSQDSHLSTHWVVTDIFGNVLYTKLSSTDLLTININKEEIGYSSKTSLVFYAIHRSASGIESEAGKSIHTIDNSNYEITSSLQRVIPYSNYSVKLKKINNSLVLKTVKYEILRVDSDDEPIIQKDLEYDTLSLTIQGELLESDSKYYLDIYTIGTDSRLNKKRKILETLPINKPYIVDLDYKYKKEISLLKSFPISTTVTNNFTLYEDTNGILPMVKVNDNKLYKGKWDRDTETIVTDGLNVYPSISLVTGDNDEIFCKVLDRSLILIDTFVNGIPTFMLYRYNAYDNTVMLLNTLPRQLETHCLGRTNSHIVKGSNLYYIPYGSKDINIYNIDTNTIVKEKTIDNISTVTNNLVLIEINSNRFLIAGGDSSTCFSYNLDTKEILKAFPLPEHFRNKELKSISLINGDAIMFVSDTTGTLSDMVYYNSFNNDLETLVLNPIGNIHPDSIIALSTGEVLFIVNEPTVSTYYKLV